MAADLLELTNQALIQLGAQTITSVTSSEDRAVTMAALAPVTRKSILRGHPWNFAMVRDQILAYAEPAATLTLSALTGTITATAGSATFVAADVNKRIRAVGMQGEATITVFTNATTVTAETSTDFIDLVLTGGGVEYRLYAKKPDFGFEFQIPLPTGYLREHAGKDSQNAQEYRVEGIHIVTDEEVLDWMYVADHTGYTFWPPDFERAYVLQLAMAACKPVTQRNEDLKTLSELAARALNDARNADGQEGTPEHIGSDILVDVRRVTGAAQFRKIRPVG